MQTNTTATPEPSISVSFITARFCCYIPYSCVVKYILLIHSTGLSVVTEYLCKSFMPDLSHTKIAESIRFCVLCVCAELPIVLTMCVVHTPTFN